jgi:hypothetical protein
MTDSAARARQILAQAGTALYGEGWKLPLSRELNIDDTSVRRWASGKDTRFDLSHPIFPKLAVMLRNRATPMMEAARLIEEETPHA